MSCLEAPLGTGQLLPGAFSRLDNPNSLRLHQSLSPCTKASFDFHRSPVSCAPFCHHSSAGPLRSPDPLPSAAISCTAQLWFNFLATWKGAGSCARARFDLRRWTPTLGGLAPFPSFPTGPGGAPGRLLSPPSSLQPALATAACPCVCRQDPPTRRTSNRIKGPRHRAAAVPPDFLAFKRFEERPG